MNIKFHKIVLHGFLSYKDAEVKLDDNGYVLIQGVNNNPIDKAVSNGAGKSAIADAICWALTGETVRGTKDIVSRYTTDGAYVSIFFDINNDNYNIIRSKDHKEYKTNLQIFVNGENKSGKGIRDSEKILEQYLPDLTSSLIGSVIILGQGLPQRFTSNSPSGRKEVLEKLSKSDFMIEDLKSRISERKLELSQKQRDFEDTILSSNSSKAVYEKSLFNAETDLQNFESPEKYDAEILDYQNKINIIEDELESLPKQISEKTEENQIASSNLLNLQAQEQQELNGIDKKYDEELDTLKETLRTLSNKKSSIEGESGIHLTTLVPIIDTDIEETIKQGKQFIFNKESYLKSEIQNEQLKLMQENQNKIKILAENYNTVNREKSIQKEQLVVLLKSKKSEITQKESIKDVCPTCGQKLPDIIKPDTTNLKNECVEIESQISNLSEILLNDKNQFEIDKTQVDNEYQNKLSNIKNQETEILEDIEYAQNKINNLYKQLISTYQIQIDDCNKKILNILEIKNSSCQKISSKYQAQKNELNSCISKLHTEISDLNNLLQTKNKLKTSLEIKLIEIKTSKEQCITQHQKLIDTITNCKVEIDKLNKKVLYITNEKENLKLHQEIVNKFETIVKRDFRGYLLSNVITYINNKAKEYAMEIFETDKIEFVLDGNNINISYDGKDYDGLSGGEKQKVDIIVQFSIRDMLCKFLNFSCNLIFLDEITDFLDKIGCEKIFNIIAGKLHDLESIFIISHHSDIAFPVDKFFTVEKGIDGVSTIRETY